MTEPRRLWVVGDSSDALDRALVEALEGELAEGVEVSLKQGPRAGDGPRGAYEALRAAVGLDADEWAREVASELEEGPAPEVILTASPEVVSIFADVARRVSARPIRIGACREPEPSARWRGAPADLLLVVDSHASALARDEDPRVRATGVPLSPPLSPPSDAPAARRAMGLDEDAHVVLIPAGAVDRRELTQLLVQLSLVRAKLEVLFEVDDPELAQQIRRLAPAHGIGASIFAAGAESAELWALPHLVLGRPRALDFARARAVGVPLLALSPVGRGERRFADALVASRSGRAAESMATLAVEVDLTLEPERFEALSDRQAELREAEPARAIAQAVRDVLERPESIGGDSVGMPAGLERVSHPRKSSGPPAERFDEAARAATEVRDRADVWEQRARLARDRGESDLALEAEKRAARHRETLNRVLRAIRPEDWQAEPEERDLDEELEALRRRSMSEGNVEQRLRSLEVEDELRALKERIAED